MSKLAEKKIVLVFGTRGSGKSYSVKKMLQQERRFLVYDIMSEYEQGIVFGTETNLQFRQFWRKCYRHNFRLVYRPIRPKVEIEMLADLVFALGDMTFVVEEIDSICSPHELPEIFSWIIQRGRHRNITLVGVTPAPFGINRDLTRQAKEIRVFRIKEPRDIDYLKNLLGAEIEAKIAALGQYEYIKWEDGKDTLTIEKA